MSKGKGFAGGVKAWHYARRRCHPRFDVSPRTGRHRRQFVSVARLEEPAFSGSHGQRQRDCKEFEGDQGGHRRKLLLRAGIGAGAGGASTFSSESAQGEVRDRRIKERDYASRGCSQSGRKEVGEVELADAVFGAKVNLQLLHEASRWVPERAPQGHDKVKEKSEFPAPAASCGSKRALAARASGSIRSPLWRHGGTVHGPRPRSYSYAMPKKMLLGASRSALLGKIGGRQVDGRGWLAA